MRTELICKGELVSPYLNTKDALRWKTDPTAIPAGAAGIDLSHDDQVKWPEMLGDIQDGVLILSVLGLHTQNPVTGVFRWLRLPVLELDTGAWLEKLMLESAENYWDILQSPDIVRKIGSG
jgi:PmbA protein